MKIIQTRILKYKTNTLYLLIDNKKVYNFTGKENITICFICFKVDRGGQSILQQLISLRFDQFFFVCVCVYVICQVQTSSKYKTLFNMQHHYTNVQNRYNMQMYRRAKITQMYIKVHHAMYLSANITQMQISINITQKKHTCAKNHCKHMYKKVQHAMYLCAIITQMYK